MAMKHLTPENVRCIESAVDDAEDAHLSGSRLNLGRGWNLGVTTAYVRVSMRSHLHVVIEKNSKRLEKDGSDAAVKNHKLPSFYD
ncbi:hypothetical protein WN48_02780 [Eufriesea mexicana]|uniref:Uncharacterized protein n=1 Tax=Eufriesea mexicana TaxID=516756 RepID=A0A310SFB2_9HYME|nr:hypothetical protein WN48_02780 [Eufriesea mexicana]